MNLDRQPNEGYYQHLYRLRKHFREADSMLNRVAVHLDKETRKMIWPLRLHVSNELDGVINALYQKD